MTDQESESTRRGAMLAALGGVLGAAALAGCSDAESDPEPGTSVESLSVTGVLKVADSIAELRNLGTGADPWIAVLEGSAAAGDIGGGVFFWSSTAAQDDGVQIVNKIAGTNAPGWRRLNGVRIAASIAGLRTMKALTVSGGAVGGGAAVLLGYTTPADGGGGQFTWTTDTTSGDDGGTVIVPTTAGARTGCWKRVYSGAVDVRWFGARPNDVAAAVTNVTAINAAITLLGGVGGTVRLDGGAYYISQTIELVHKQSILISGGGTAGNANPGGAVALKAAPTFAGAAVLKLRGCFRCEVRNLLLDGSGTATIGLHHTALAGQNAGDQCLYEDLQVISAAVGVKLGEDTPAASQSLADNVFRRLMIRMCPVGIEQRGKGQTSETLYDGGVIVHSSIGFRMVQGNATMRDFEITSTDNGSPSTPMYDVMVEDTATDAYFERNNHELYYSQCVAYYFPSAGSSSRSPFTRLDGVRVLWIPPTGGIGGFVDYRQQSVLTAISCQWACNTIPTTGSVEVKWTGPSVLTTAPRVTEIGCQYFNGATASIGPTVVYATMGTAAGALGNYKSLGLYGPIYLNANALGSPPSPSSGGMIYVDSLGRLVFSNASGVHIIAG